MQRLEYRNAVAFHRQVVRRNQRCRSASHQRDARSLRQIRGGLSRVTVCVRHKSLERSNRHRLQFLPEQASVLAKALVLAHAPANSRKRAPLKYGFQSARKIVLRQMRDEALDIDMQR